MLESTSPHAHGGQKNNFIERHTRRALTYHSAAPAHHHYYRQMASLACASTCVDAFRRPWCSDAVPAVCVANEISNRSRIDFFRRRSRMPSWYECVSEWNRVLQIILCKHTKRKQRTIGHDKIYSSKCCRLSVCLCRKLPSKWMGCETVFQHQMSF